MRRLFIAMGMLTALAAFMAVMAGMSVFGMWIVGAPWGSLLPAALAALVGSWLVAGDVAN